MRTLCGNLWRVGFKGRNRGDNSRSGVRCLIRITGWVSAGPIYLFVVFFFTRLSVLLSIWRCQFTRYDLYGLAHELTVKSRISLEVTQLISPVQLLRVMTEALFFFSPGRLRKSNRNYNLTRAVLYCTKNKTRQEKSNLVNPIPTAYGNHNWAAVLVSLLSPSRNADTRCSTPETKPLLSVPISVDTW